jgi:hypothetical protein
MDVSQRTQPQRFEGLHWMGYQLADSRYHIALSGVAILDFLANSATNWRRETYHLEVMADRAIAFLNLPAPPPGQANALRSEQKLLYASLNALKIAHPTNDFGYAVDRFYFGTAPNSPEPNILDSVAFSVDLAVRNDQADLIRVAYHLIVVGSLVTLPIPS